MTPLSLIGMLIELLRPLRWVILPGFFITFFLCTMIALAFAGRTWIRRSYLAGFFVLLLIFNLLSPPVILPMMKWSKFSDPYPQENDVYRLRVVDASGDELYYDGRATMAIQGVSKAKLIRKMRHEYSPEENRAIGAWLLQRARVRRAGLAKAEPRDLLRWSQFPPHAIPNNWRREDLDRYERFVGIRIYEIHIETTPDGSEATAVTERKVFEYMDPDDADASTGPNGQPNQPMMNARMHHVR